MPRNNNQKVQTAAERLAKLPVVRSAFAMLSVFYLDSKCRHPNLMSVCEGLERSVTAIVAPVIVKLEPQISIANDVACKGLDWLETTFPVIHSPMEEIVTTAKNKVNELQDVACIAATGTVDCVRLTVAWLMYRLQQGDDQAAQTPVQRAISVACLGLDSALTVSEALVDRVLPAPHEEEEVHLLEGFDTSAPPRGYSVRLVALTTKLYRRTRSRMQLAQVTAAVSGSGLFQDLHTRCVTTVESLQRLPQYVQHQLVTALFFIYQMYHLGCPPSQPQQCNGERSEVSEAETSTRKRVIQLNPHARPPTRHLRSASTSVFERGCSVKRCLNR